MMLCGNSSKKILVISSDKSLVDTLDSCLTKRGYQLTSIQGVDDGFNDLLQNLGPMLVIVDINMPSMSGIETLLRVHELSSAPTIMLSSWKAAKNTLKYLNVHYATDLSDMDLEDVASWVDSLVKHLPAESVDQQPEASSV